MDRIKVHSTIRKREPEEIKIYETTDGRRFSYQGDAIHHQRFIDAEEVVKDMKIGIWSPMKMKPKWFGTTVVKVMVAQE